MKQLSESRILIVDDAKTNVDILVNALRDEYKLSVALDGTAAPSRGSSTVASPTCGPATRGSRS